MFFHKFGAIEKRDYSIGVLIMAQKSDFLLT